MRQTRDLLLTFTLCKDQLLKAYALNQILREDLLIQQLQGLLDQFLAKHKKPQPILTNLTTKPSG